MVLLHHEKNIVNYYKFIKLNFVSIYLSYVTFWIVKNTQMSRVDGTNKKRSVSYTL